MDTPMNPTMSGVIRIRDAYRAGEAAKAVLAEKAADERDLRSEPLVDSMEWLNFEDAMTSLGSAIQAALHSPDALSAPVAAKESSSLQHA